MTPLFSENSLFWGSLKESLSEFFPLSCGAWKKGLKYSFPCYYCEYLQCICRSYSGCCLLIGHFLDITYFCKKGIYILYLSPKGLFLHVEKLQYFHDIYVYIYILYLVGSFFILQEKSATFFKPHCLYSSPNKDTWPEGTRSVNNDCWQICFH